MTVRTIEEIEAWLESEIHDSYARPVRLDGDIIYQNGRRSLAKSLLDYISEGCAHTSERFTEKDAC